jgi:hypothetical protein
VVGSFSSRFIGVVLGRITANVKIVALLKFVVNKFEVLDVWSCHDGRRGREEVRAQRTSDLYTRIFSERVFQLPLPL